MNSKLIKKIYIPIWIIGIYFGVLLIKMFIGTLGIIEPVINVILIAWIISIVINPFVNFLVSKKVNKILAVNISFIIFILFVVSIFIYLIPVVLVNLNGLIQNLSYSNITRIIYDIKSSFGLHISIGSTFILSRLQTIVNSLLDNMLQFLQNLASIVSQFFLSLFISYYFLLSGGSWKEIVYIFLPEKYRGDFLVFTETTRKIFSEYMKFQGLTSLALSIFFFLLLWLLGVNYPFISALFAFLLYFIPVFGIFIAPLIGFMIAINQSITLFWVIFIAYFLFSETFVNIIIPRLAKTTFGIHPVIFFIAVIAGYSIFGIIGAMFAVPVASLIQAIIKHFILKSAND